MKGGRQMKITVGKILTVFAFYLLFSFSMETAGNGSGTAGAENGSTTTYLAYDNPSDIKLPFEF